MKLATYTTYKDFKGEDVSYKNSIHSIKQIFGNYRREIVLKFLGHCTTKIGLENSPEVSYKVQDELGIKANGILVHTRAIICLFQIFYDADKFSNINIDNRLSAEDHELLFLYANQIISKTDSVAKEDYKGTITIEYLMTMMRMHVGVITSFELKISVEIFSKLYKKLAENNFFSDYNEVVMSTTNLSIEDFILIIENFLTNIRNENIFEKFEKFAVLFYNNIYDKWNNRIPQIKIPLDYRFIEEYPLIKLKENFYPVSAIMMFMAISRKIYHVLSNDEKTKSKFRSLWGKQIVEPVIKNYIKEIFESDNIRVIDKDAQTELGFEITDIMIVHNNDIFLIEIKSGYMALNHRFTDDPAVFKENFENKYVYTDTGKHQLSNQLDTFYNNYNKISNLYGLERGIQYRVFSNLLVFDEALSMIGFKMYLGKLFFDIVNPKISNYENKFLPFPYPNLMTFTELLIFEKRIPSKIKRLELLKALFNYNHSLPELLEDIKENRIKVDGITKNDFN